MIRDFTPEEILRYLDAYSLEEIILQSELSEEEILRILLEMEVVVYPEFLEEDTPDAASEEPSGTSQKPYCERPPDE